MVPNETDVPVQSVSLSLCPINEGPDMDNSELLTIAQEYGTPTFVFDVEEF